jgi:hypothetical protein
MEQVLLNVTLQSTEEFWDEVDVLSAFISFVKSRGGYSDFLTVSCSF